MKKKNIFSIMTVAVMLSLSLASCISDDSTDGNKAIPQLAIEGSDATTMPEYNIYLGNECVIKPAISYNGNSEDLKYQWMVGTYTNGQKGDLEEVSTEPELKYNFTSGGSYYVHLNVTDGKVGKTVNYQVNVNRTFENGYLITSSDADGKGNLSFVKILTPEEIAAGEKEVVVEHCMEKINEDVSEDGLLKAFIATANLWDGSHSSVLKRVLVSTQDRCYFLDPNNFTVLTSIDYASLYPGFKASAFMPDSYMPYAYDKDMKKFAHINLQFMFPYDYQYFHGCEPEQMVENYFSQWGTPTEKTFFLNYSANTVAIFSSYASWYGFDNNFPDCKNLLDGQKLITAFSGVEPNDSYITPVYILSKDESSNELYLWENGSTNFMEPAGFVSQKMAITDNTAVPAQGASFVVTATYGRYYYAVDNAVYVFLPQNTFSLPNKNQYAIQFGANEEVTYLYVDLATNELYVATYDKNTKRGSFYIYDCADVRTDNAGNVQPKESHKNCAGRISYVIHKPSIQ